MTMRDSHLAPEHLRAAVAVLDDVLPTPKSPESAEVSAQESTQESMAVGEVSPKSLWFLVSREGLEPSTP